jgi:nucleoside triphosphate pyrophosphatase
VAAPRLILASRSPRRAQLLRDAGFAFEQVDPPFADPPAPHVHGEAEAEALAARLAEQKARSALPYIELDDQSETIVIGADTIVVAPDGSLMGTPTDEADARRMLEVMSDATHQVVTGVALAAHAAEGDRCESFADAAAVHLGPLSGRDIDAYLATGRWRGKAGAYNLFERMDHWPIEVEGDPTAVVGLPMRMLASALRRLGVNPFVPLRLPGAP